jgi:hypothetical protein
MTSKNNLNYRIVNFYESFSSDRFKVDKSIYLHIAFVKAFEHHWLTEEKKILKYRKLEKRNINNQIEFYYLDMTKEEEAIKSGKASDPIVLTNSTSGNYWNYAASTQRNNTYFAAIINVTKFLLLLNEVDLFTLYGFALNNEKINLNALLMELGFDHNYYELEFSSNSFSDDYDSEQERSAENLRSLDDVSDDEDSIMRSFRNGTSDNFGF